jgi:hypothetical protein
VLDALGLPDEHTARIVSLERDRRIGHLRDR